MTLPARLTILIHEWVTGGGLAGQDLPPSWAAEGRAIRRALATEFASLGAELRVIVTLDARFPNDSGPWTSIRIGDGDDPDRLLSLAKQADYTLLIAPETMGVLARLARSLDEVGAVSLGCSPESIELTGNKARLSDWFMASGIPTPSYRRILPDQKLPRDFHYPAVVKPIDGAGAVDTYLISNDQSPPEQARIQRESIIQPHCPGFPMSGSFLVAENHPPWLLGFGLQQVEIVQGRFCYLGGQIPVECPEAEFQVTRAVAAVPGLRGFVGVDFLWEPGAREAMILEINPRATTSLVGLCGILPSRHLAQAWLAVCGVPGYSLDLLCGLAEAIAQQPAVRFDAEGNLWPLDKELAEP